MSSKSIIEKVRCPRCNADAAIRVLEFEDFLQLILMCPMCRLRQHRGLTTRRALRLEKQIEKWSELLNSGRKINENSKILARIELLKKKLEKEKLGIRS